MLIMDSDGNRIVGKYYDKTVFPSTKEEKAYEKSLFNKTRRCDENTDIIMLDGLTCVYKANVDVYFYVMGSSHENELLLVNVLSCLYDSISIILKKDISRQSVLRDLDIVLLTFDEICDGG